MKRLTLKDYSKYMIVVLFLVILYLSFQIIRPYLIAIFAAVILTYLFYPTYRFIKKILKNPDASAFITSLFIVLLVAIPLVFLANALIQQSVDLYTLYTESDTIKKVAEKYISPEVSPKLESIILKGISFVAEKSYSFISDLPIKIINFFLMLFIMFYLFKDGNRIVAYIKKILPLKQKEEEMIVKQFDDTIYAMIYGTILISILEGIAATIGFYLFGVPMPVLWGAVTALLAMFPYIGPGIVWIPAVFYKYMTGDVTNAIGLAIFSIVVITVFLDLILKSKWIANKANVHPIIILLGILGGINVFGLFGIIMGPLVLALFVLFIQIYLKRK